MKRESAVFSLTTALIAVTGLILIIAATASGGGPLPANTAPGADGRLQIDPADRCPVCAMFPARRPDAAAAMTFTNGEAFYFCSNGCLLRSWLRPDVYLGRPAATIDRLIVLDYFSGRPIDARTATWVAGSDVVGPMGPAIVALGDPGQLGTFKRRHGSRTVFTFDQLDDALWRRMGRRDLPPPTK